MSLWSGKHLKAIQLALAAPYQQHAGVDSRRPESGRAALPVAVS